MARNDYNSSKSYYKEINKACYTVPEDIRLYESTYGKPDEYGQQILDITLKMKKLMLKALYYHINKPLFYQSKIDSIATETYELLQKRKCLVYDRGIHIKRRTK